MDTGLCYVQVHGARLGWAKRTLEAAGVAVHAVTRDTGSGLYYLAIPTDNADRASSALLPLENYQRAKPRKSIDLRIMDALLIVGLGVAGVVALVTPIGGGVVLALLAIVRFAFGQMHGPAAELWRLGGKWRLGGVIGVTVVMGVFVVFLASVGGMAAMKIAEGNSALKLLGG